MLPRTMRLEWANQGDLQIRPEILPSGHPGASLRVLYASDLHLFDRRPRRVAVQLIEAARAAKPDVILLGGDLVDRRAAIPALAGCIRALRETAPVGAIRGNHDCWGNAETLRAAVEEAGGSWLDRHPMTIPLAGGVQARIDGRIQAAPDGAALRILCAHNPAVYLAARRAGYHAVLAGHLHGGQVVWAQSGGKLYPGAWFYRWNGLRFEDAGCTMLVSRGVSDTLPLRWNCPREVLLCTWENPR